MNRASLKTLRMPPDTYERHSLIAQLSGSPETVLDVGGVRGELDPFLPGSRVTTINIAGEQADTYFDGSHLPFDESTFDVAVSLDVLEHIPAPERELHLAELARVAKRKVILCCPLGSPLHDDAEKELADWYRATTGEEHRFLREHIETGLPDEAELNRLAAGRGVEYRLRFHGDFRRANAAFRASTGLRSGPGPRTALSYARFRFDPRRSLTLDEHSSEWSNRAFVEIEIARKSDPH